MYNGLLLTDQTFAKRLHQSGYKTGAIGKWYLRGSDIFIQVDKDSIIFTVSYFPENVKTHMPLIIPKNGTPNYSANEVDYQPLTRNDKPGEFNEYLTTTLSKYAAKFKKKHVLSKFRHLS